MKKIIITFAILFSFSISIANDWGRELKENKTGTTVLGAITSATGGYMIAKGVEKTILGNTGCNYPTSFIARSFRGTKTRCAGIVLALAGLATFDIGATILSEPEEGIKFYRHFTSKTFKSVYSLVSLFAKQSKDSQNNNEQL